MDLMVKELLSITTVHKFNTWLANVDEKFQTVFGWGGAFTDSAAINIAALEPEAQDLLIRSDPSQKTGCRILIITYSPSAALFSADATWHLFFLTYFRKSCDAMVLLFLLASTQQPNKAYHVWTSTQNKWRECVGTSRNLTQIHPDVSQ